MIYFEDSGTGLDLLWHLGDALPAVAQRRVVRLQADGDELQVILAALRGGGRVLTVGADRTVAPGAVIDHKAAAPGDRAREAGRPLYADECPACRQDPCVCSARKGQTDGRS